MLSTGSPLKKLSPKNRLDLVTAIVQSKLPAAQKCIAIGIAVLSDEEGEIALGAEDLKCLASVNKRDTVFGAKKDLEVLKLIAKDTTPGKANKYRIVPPNVMAEILRAFHATKGLVPNVGTSPVPENGIGDVPILGTSTRPRNGTGPVPKSATSPEKGDGSRALALAHFETPSGLDLSCSQTTTTVEQDAARGGGREENSDFPGLNGTATELVKFIGRHAIVDEPTARHMLKTNIHAFGIEPMLEAYSVTIAEMATRGVAAPYKFLMGCARNAKERKTQPASPSPPKEGSTARTMRLAKEASERLRIADGRS